MPPKRPGVQSLRERTSCSLAFVPSFQTCADKDTLCAVASVPTVCANPRAFAVYFRGGGLVSWGNDGDASRVQERLINVQDVQATEPCDPRDTAIKSGRGERWRSPRLLLSEERLRKTEERRDVKHIAFSTRRPSRTNWNCNCLTQIL